MIVMKVFTVSRFASNGNYELQAYIGFEDRPFQDSNRILCYGSALVELEDKHEFLFGYWFGHSPAWDQVTDIILNPTEENILTGKEMDLIGNAIIKSIITFISQAN